MKVVVDTNVLVSGLLSPGGPPGTIINMIAGGDLQVCYDPRVFAEYRAVLGRPEFDIPANAIIKLLAQIAEFGGSIACLPPFLRLPDPSDAAFLEVALAAQAECLITGNLRHFPSSCRQAIRVLSPREFLDFYREQQAGGSGKVKSPPARYKAKRRRS